MRYLFGGTGADWAYGDAEVEDVNGTPVTVARFRPGSVITFYDARTEGTQLVVSSDADGQNIMTVTANADGFIDTEFYGPDGVTSLYASAGGGPRVKMTADLTPSLAIETAARVQGDADTLAAANAYTDAHVGSGGGAVDSVNGQTGVVLLDADDVGARSAAQAVPAADVSGLSLVATSGVYSDLTSRPNLASVALSGSYSDLSGRPDVYTKSESDQRYALASATTYPATLKAWFEAIKVRDRLGLDILVVGDSWGEGQGATYISNRWLDKLKPLLRAQLTPSSIPGGYGFVPGYYALSGYTQPWATTGTVTQQESFGLGYRQLRLDPNATMSYTFSGTGCDLFYAIGNTGGTFRWTIDGGSGSSTKSPIATNSGSLNYGGNVLSLRGLPAGSHTLQLTQTATASQYAYVEGIAVYNGDAVGGKGLRVWDASHYGYDTSQMLGGTGNLWGSIAAVPASLVMVPLGINDWRHKAVTPAQYATNLTNLVTTLRQHVARDASIMLWTMPETTTVTSPLAPWADFKAQVATVAANVGAYVFDASAIVPNYTGTDKTRWNADGIHPNDAGHQALANALATVLLPS